MKKALILIDYINEICHQDGAFGCYPMLSAHQVIPKVNKILAQAREAGWLIIWVKVAFDKNYLELNSKSPLFAKANAYNKLQRGTWGTEFLTELDFDENEVVICKNAVNPFHGTNLDNVLRVNGVEELYLAGVSTEVAIQSCTRDGHDRGYLVNVIADCCASSNLPRHEASLEMLGYLANVIASDTLS